MNAIAMQCSVRSTIGACALAALCMSAGLSAPTDSFAAVSEVVDGALAPEPSAAQARPIRLEVSTVAAVATQPAAAGRHAFTEEVDYRLWVGKRRTSFGVGFTSPLYGSIADGTAQGFNGPWRNASSPSMVVGVRYSMDDSSRLYVGTESRQLRQRLGAAASDSGNEREHNLRVGLELRPVSRAAAMGLSRDQLLRLQLSVSSQVSLRVRGGGVAVVYRSQF